MTLWSPIEVLKRAYAALNCMGEGAGTTASFLNCLVLSRKVRKGLNTLKSLSSNESPALSGSHGDVLMEAHGNVLRKHPYKFPSDLPGRSMMGWASPLHIRALGAWFGICLPIPLPQFQCPQIFSEFLNRALLTSFLYSQNSDPCHWMRLEQGSPT